jgi:hypothetical protein
VFAGGVYASAAGNVIDGANWIPTGTTINGCTTPNTGSGPVGIEVDGGVGDRFFNNEILNFVGSGMVLFGTSCGAVCTEISGYNPFDPYDSPKYIEYNNFGAIWLYGSSPWGYNDNPVLSHVRATNNTGLAAVFFDNVTGDGYHGFVDDACMYSNVSNVGVAGSTSVNTTPSSYSSCP